MIKQNIKIALKYCLHVKIWIHLISGVLILGVFILCFTRLVCIFSISDQSLSSDIQTNLMLQCEAASQKRCCLGYEWADIICVYVTVPQTHGCHFSDGASGGEMQKLITFQKKCEECVLLRDHFHCLFMQECYFYNFCSPLLLVSPLLHILLNPDGKEGRGGLSCSKQKTS